ncbi:MAG TPA: alkylhydroperoxidase [Xanthomonadaceae bacterium]|nr:alkylhydroperoxidase [Xanthomonadaceae bacterium]
MHFHRIDYTHHEAAAFQALLGASRQVHDGVLGAELAELVFLRVSQLNGCAYCIDMHATALRKAGMPPRKLDTLPGWRESRFFDARERAALAWAEALTTLPSGAPADAVYHALAAHFDDHGVAELTMAVAIINAWNRLGVGLQPALP